VKKPMIIMLAVLLLAALAVGVICAANGGTGLPMPGGITQQDEDPDGDCDEGDKRESRPDPDCNGVWYGTPTPGAARTPATRKTTAPAATKGSVPRPGTTRR
jgi:hypothetical protein